MNIVDTIVKVSNEEALETSKTLGALEGIFCGISSGAAAWAAMETAAKPENRAKKIVVILPDTGERYLSAGFSAA